MKLQGAYIFLILTVLYSCKTSQNHSFIKSKQEKQVRLVDIQKPYVSFVLETGDTLKFNKVDISNLIEKNSKNQNKIQGYISNKSWQEISSALTKDSNDTTVYQNLSAVNDKTLSGILDVWIAKVLLLQGKAIIAQKNKADRPKKLRYIFIQNKLGGQEGTFYTETNKEIYRTVIALGE
jgi:hypothetical protein